MLPFVYIFILGLIIGSFVNVVVHRVPLGQSIVRGRSRCPHCRKTLAWYDLIPIVSFLILAGQCRYCKKGIVPVYPAVEIYSGLIFIFSYWLFSSSGLGDWLFTIFILELFLILGLIDLKHLILPDFLLMVLLGVSIGLPILYRIFDIKSGWQVFNPGNFIGAALLFGAIFAIWFLSKGRGLGLGDAKLAGIIGLIFGFWNGLIILYIAVILGALLGTFLLLTHRGNLKTKLPLGTFICASATFFTLGGGAVLSRFAPIFYTAPLIFK